jgi:hypothetical protein
MSVNLSISTEEAKTLINCLAYVRSNCVFDVANVQVRKIADGPMTLRLRDAIGIDFLRDYIETQSELAANARPVNPFFNFN